MSEAFLKDKTAIITGGTKGIGLGIARELVRAGANAVVTARNSDEVLMIAHALSLLNEETKPKGLVCDVRDYDQVQETVKQIAELYGRIDILINNAGIGYFNKNTEEMLPEEFRATIETNLNGVFYFCREAIPHLKKAGGYIINISSLAGANAHPGMAAYNASKFALNGFSEALMQEVRHYGIKVSYIMPGSVNTHFGGDEPSSVKSWQLQPQDIARVVIDLLKHDERSLPSRIEIRPSRPPR